MFFALVTAWFTSYAFAADPATAEIGSAPDFLTLSSAPKIIAESSISDSQLAGFSGHNFRQTIFFAFLTTDYNLETDNYHYVTKLASLLSPGQCLRVTLMSRGIFIRT